MDKTYFVCLNVMNFSVSHIYEQAFGVEGGFWLKFEAAHFSICPKSCHFRPLEKKVLLVDLNMSHTILTVFFAFIEQFWIVPCEIHEVFSPNQ